eukprot:tig00021521_g22072.t1
MEEEQEALAKPLSVGPVKRYVWNEGRLSARRATSPGRSYGSSPYGSAGRPVSAPRRLPSDGPGRAMGAPPPGANGFSMHRPQSPTLRQRPSSARLARGYNGIGYDPVNAYKTQSGPLTQAGSGVHLPRPISAGLEVDLVGARTVMNLRRARIAGAWGNVALEEEGGTGDDQGGSRRAGTGPASPLRSGGAGAGGGLPSPVAAKPVYYKDVILSSAMAAAESGGEAMPAPPPPAAAHAHGRRPPASGGGGGGSRLLRTMTNVRKVLRKRTLFVFGGFGDQGGSRGYWRKAWQVYETYWGRRPPKEALESDGGCSYMFADTHALGTGREGINWYPRLAHGGPTPRVRASASHLRLSTDMDGGWSFGNSIVVVFGGTDVRQRFSDVHVFDVDAARWVRPELQTAAGADGPGSGPRKRDGHAAAVAWREVMLVHGGRGPNGRPLDDMWGLYRADDALEWGRVRQSSYEGEGLLPTPRCDHTLTFVFPGALIMYGGRSADDVRRPEFETAYYCCPDDIYVAGIRRGSGPRVPFGPSPPIAVEWRRARSAGERPRPRYGHCAAFVMGRLWVFGGAILPDEPPVPGGPISPPPQYSNELFAYEPRTGEWTAYGGYDGAWPRPREGASMWPVGRSMLFLFGGWTGRRDGPWLSELHCFDTTNPDAGWIRLYEFDERAPLPRYGHAGAICDMTNVDPAQCFAEGAGLRRCKAGEESWFRVVAVSDDGEQMEQGGDLRDMRVEIRGPKVEEGDWEAAAKDTYGNPCFGEEGDDDEDEEDEEGEEEEEGAEATPEKAKADGEAAPSASASAAADGESDVADVQARAAGALNALRALAN